MAFNLVCLMNVLNLLITKENLRMRQSELLIPFFDILDFFYIFVNVLREAREKNFTTDQFTTDHFILFVRSRTPIIENCDINEAMKSKKLQFVCNLN